MNSKDQDIAILSAFNLTFSFVAFPKEVSSEKINNAFSEEYMNLEEELRNSPPLVDCIIKTKYGHFPTINQIFKIANKGFLDSVKRGIVPYSEIYGSLIDVLKEIAKEKDSINDLMDGVRDSFKNTDHDDIVNAILSQGICLVSYNKMCLIKVRNTILLDVVED